MDNLVGSKNAEVINKLIHGNKLIQYQVRIWFYIIIDKILSNL